MWVKRQRRVIAKQTVEGAARNRGTQDHPTHPRALKVRDYNTPPASKRSESIVKTLYLATAQLTSFGSEFL